MSPVAKLSVSVNMKVCLSFVIRTCYAIARRELLGLQHTWLLFCHFHENILVCLLHVKYNYFFCVALIKMCFKISLCLKTRSDIADFYWQTLKH